jgi:glycosyltransferase domain-containing protein
VNKLTFVLPLKDRPEHSKEWLRHNVHREYDYLVADGSIGSENEALFRDLQLPNLTYVRFAPDQSIEVFVEKMFQAVSQVKTDYVMTCDNDDFINQRGVSSCIDALDENPEAVCAGGPIYGVYQYESAAREPRYGMPFKILDAVALTGKSGFDALVELLRNYRPMWYSVFRTSPYQKIWSDIRQLKIVNVYLVEILQAELTFCQGKYVQVPVNHYIRLQNPSTSCARANAAAGESHSGKIFFDEGYRSQVIRMSEHVAALVGVSVEQLLNEMTNYYVAGNTHQPDSFAARMSARLGKLHESIPRKLGITFPIETGIDFVNGLQTVRNRLGA